MKGIFSITFGICEDSGAIGRNELNTGLSALSHTPPATKIRCSALAPNIGQPKCSNRRNRVHVELPVNWKAMAKALVLHAAVIRTVFLRAFRLNNASFETTLFTRFGNVYAVDRVKRSHRKVTTETSKTPN